VQSRFQDAGETLWTFGDELLVRCPACQGRAVVRPDPREPRRQATLTCGGCGLARRTPDERAQVRTRRCPRCDRWIPSRAWRRVEEGPRSERREARCPRCGNVVRGVIAWTTTGVPEDPFFGAPLWLQAPCCGDLLWAWNLRHLELLAAFVGATLRERPATGTGTGSMAWRLPRWMKLARNRAEVLAAIDRLRATLRPARGRP
jgi:hypothetical protein